MEGGFDELSVKGFGGGRCVVSCAELQLVEIARHWHSSTWFCKPAAPFYTSPRKVSSFFFGSFYSDLRNFINTLQNTKYIHHN